MKCLHPIYLKDNIVPCGKCYCCLLNKQNSWIFRLQQESRDHQSSLFVTLTYDDEHLSSIRHDGKLYHVVDKRDIELFIKRLRNHGRTKDTIGEEVKVRFFCASEYGDNGNRPHYHMILFGLNFSPENVLICLTRLGKMDLYRLNPLIWPA